MNATTNDLGTVAAQIAMKSAVQYLTVHKLKADPAALAECLKSWCKIQLPAALHDAREAMNCGMSQIAEATFAATMSIAGIEAAKEAGFPI